MNFSVVFCVERALESTKLAIPESLELQILLVSTKHDRVQIKTFSLGKPLGSLQKLKCYPWFLWSSSYTLSRHNVSLKCTSEYWTLDQKIFLSYNFLWLKKDIFILDTLEQFFLSAYFTSSQSILGQNQGKNCNRPMLITASYLYLTRESPWSS